MKHLYIIAFTLLLTVSSAALQAPVPSVPIGIYAVANTTWSESALTWNNKPATGAGLDTNTVANTAYAYIPFDVRRKNLPTKATLTDSFLLIE